MKTNEKNNNTPDAELQSEELEQVVGGIAPTNTRVNGYGSLDGSAGDGYGLNSPYAVAGDPRDQSDELEGIGSYEDRKKRRD